MYAQRGGWKAGRGNGGGLFDIARKTPARSQADASKHLTA